MYFQFVFAIRDELIMRFIDLGFIEITVVTMFKEFCQNLTRDYQLFMINSLETLFYSKFWETELNFLRKV